MPVCLPGFAEAVVEARCMRLHGLGYQCLTAERVVGGKRVRVGCLAGVSFGETGKNAVSGKGDLE
jgi:hypothetical protein